MGEGVSCTTNPFKNARSSKFLQIIGSRCLIKSYISDVLRKVFSLIIKFIHVICTGRTCSSIFPLGSLGTISALPQILLRSFGQLNLKNKQIRIKIEIIEPVPGGYTRAILQGISKNFKVGEHSLIYKNIARLTILTPSGTFSTKII